MFCHKPNPGQFVVPSETTSDRVALSTKADGKHCRPRWRWSGIRKTPIHRMPHDTSSGRRQREDATLRRKRRNCNRPMELQVRRCRHRVKYDHNRRGFPSLHTIAHLTLCDLKNQRMGPAMRKQKRPLSCWRYSMTTSHGVIQRLCFCSLINSGCKICMNDMAVYCQLHLGIIRYDFTEGLRVSCQGLGSQLTYFSHQGVGVRC